MGGLGAETLGTETFLVSVLVSVPVRPKMSGLKKVLVLRDFIQGLGLGLGLGLD